MPSGSSFRLTAVSSNISRAALGILDQALVSVPTYGMNLALARWLTTEEYGVFALAFSVLILFNAAASALVLEPLTVMASTCFHRFHSDYTDAVLRMQIVSAVPAFLVAVLVATVALVANVGVLSVIAKTIVSFPPILMFWVLRRMCYLHSNPVLALQGSAVYAAALASAILALKARTALSAGNAFVAVGLASTVACALHWKTLMHSINKNSRDTLSNIDSKEILKKHWSYGKWIGGVAVGGWVLTGAYPAVLAYSTGLASAATYRAIDILMAPVAQICTALSLQILPSTCRHISSKDGLTPNLLMARTSLLVLATLTPCIVFLCIWGRPVTKALFAKEQFANAVWLIPYLGGAIIMRAINDIALGNISRAFSRPDINCSATVGAALVTVVVGFPAVMRFGLSGVCAGLTLACTVEFSIYAVLLYQLLIRGEGSTVRIRSPESNAGRYHNRSSDVA